MRDAFCLSDDERQTRELARALTPEQIPPPAAPVDGTESYPAEQLPLVGAQALMGQYMPTGTKMWVTNGSHASVLTLFATVDRGRSHKGVTAFLVEPTFPGFALGKLERKMGVRGSPTVAIHLADCEVPVENRLGNEGEGFRVALGALDRSRPAVGAQAVGIAQAALDAAVGYAKERRQFGQPIATFQGTQFMLADMAR